MKKPPPEGMKWCAQCKGYVPERLFADMPRGYRVTLCNRCGRENVAAWKRTQTVGKRPEDFGLNGGEGER